MGLIRTASCVLVLGAAISLSFGNLIDLRAIQQAAQEAQSSPIKISNFYASGKLVTYGSSKVTLPTYENMLIEAGELLSKSLPYIPKDILSELNILANDLMKFNDKKTDKLISQTQYIMKIVRRDSFKNKCDYRDQLMEGLNLVLLLLKNNGIKYPNKYY